MKQKEPMIKVYYAMGGLSPYIANIEKDSVFLVIKLSDFNTYKAKMEKEIKGLRKFYDILNLDWESKGNALIINEFKKKFPNFYKWLSESGFAYNKDLDYALLKQQLAERDNDIKVLDTNYKNLIEVKKEKDKEIKTLKGG